MKLILMAGTVRHAVLTVPDNTAQLEKVILPEACLDCMKMEMAEYEFRGIHDDGRIYEFVGYAND